MAHMSEKEWAAFAADKHIDAATGGALKAPVEAGTDPWDYERIMRKFASLENMVARTQTYLVVGFALLAILHVLVR